MRSLFLRVAEGRSMPNAAALLHRLFGSPGGTATNTEELLGPAAAAHAGLLTCACARGDLARGRSLAPLLAFLRGPAPAAQKRRLLYHPLFIEGLHGLAPFFADLQRWHDSVTAPLTPAPADQTVPAARVSLGNVALVLLLRADRHWHGEHDFCTDVLGRVGFSFSDWSLTLYTDHTSSSPVRWSRWRSNISRRVGGSRTAGRYRS
jgi:hypothetical protein